jgi:mannose-6-phosphate isomerase-like protein (cupin superfamily)
VSPCGNRNPVTIASRIAPQQRPAFHGGTRQTCWIADGRGHNACAPHVSKKVCWAAERNEDETVSGYSINIENKTLENSCFREVLFTASRMQLVIMSLAPGDEIGLETHDDVDQFIRVEAGAGKAILDGAEHELEDGSAVVIPAGTAHNVVNTSRTEALKLYSIYTPPEHPDGTIHKDKAQADAYEREQHG